MILTKKLLIQWDACQEGIDFCERNKLFGFDLDRIDEIKGDYDCFINWLKSELRIEREYDSKGNVILQKLNDGLYVIGFEYNDDDNIIRKEDSDGDWVKWEYDGNGNQIKEETSSGGWVKWEYDSKGNVIKEEDSDGDWVKWEYDLNNNCIKKEKSNGCFIKYEYDSIGNCSREENYLNFCKSFKYDSNGNRILVVCSNDYSYEYKTEIYPNGQLKRIGSLYLPLV